MIQLFLKIIPVLIFWGIFILVVLYIPYPESLIQAKTVQLSLFFTSLFLATTFTFNIFLKNFLMSFSISLGIIVLLILKALDSFNLITALLTIISVGLLVSYFRKTKKHLTKLPKIHKIRALQKN